METKSAVLILYKDFLRTARRFPLIYIRKKLELNIKEIFQHRQRETDEATIAKYLSDGNRNLEVLKKVSHLDRRSLELLLIETANPQYD
jgi:hypothetical protein